MYTPKHIPWRPTSKHRVKIVLKHAVHPKIAVIKSDRTASSASNMKNGFTLIELIVVLAIMGLITSMGFAFYNSYTQNAQLSQEASRLMDVLTVAQKKSTSPDTCGVQTNQGYQVVTVATTYSLQLCCGPQSGSCTTASTIQNYTLPSFITLTSATIQFQTLSRGVIGAATLTLKNSNSSKCIDTTVNASGTISQGSPYGC